MEGNRLNRNSKLTGLAKAVDEKKGRKNKIIQYIDVLLRFEIDDSKTKEKGN